MSSAKSLLTSAKHLLTSAKPLWTAAVPTLDFCRAAFDFCRAAFKFCRAALDFCRGTFDSCRAMFDFCQAPFEFCQAPFHFCQAPAKPLLTSAGSSWAVFEPISADLLLTSSLHEQTCRQRGPTGWHIDYERNIRKRERSLFFSTFFAGILACSGFCNLDATWNQLGITYCSLRDNLDSL